MLQPNTILIRALPFFAMVVAKWTIGWLCFRPSTIADTLVFAGVMLVIMVLIAVVHRSYRRLVQWHPRDERRLRLLATPLVDECV